VSIKTLRSQTRLPRARRVHADSAVEGKPSAMHANVRVTQSWSARRAHAARGVAAIATTVLCEISWAQRSRAGGVTSIGGCVVANR
jgi:hypothetical protein